MAAKIDFAQVNGCFEVVLVMQRVKIFGLTNAWETPESLPRHQIGYRGRACVQYQAGRLV